MITGTSIADDVNVEFVSHLGRDVSNVAVSGDYAYIGQGNELVILDISDASNLSNLSEMGRVTTPSVINDITVKENYVYVADDSSGLVIVDISAPTSPTLEGNYDTGYAYGVSVSGNCAYVADLHDGLVIVDVSTSTSPTLAGMGSYNSGDAWDVAVSGKYAYVAFGAGLVIVDISAPTSPTLVGSYDTGYAYSVSVSDNYAYITDYTTGLFIVDVSTPTSPTRVGSYDTEDIDGNTRGVAVSGNYAYVVDGDKGLVIVDISNPTSPTLASSYDTDGNAKGIAVSGNYIYVADGDNGLVILRTDIQDQGLIDGSLVQVEGSSDVYLIKNGMKHLFTSPEALLWNEHSFDNIISVTSEILQNYPDGEDISISQPIIDKYHALGGEPIFGAPSGEGEKVGDQDSAGTYCSYVNFENGAIECFKNGDHTGEAYAIFNPLYTKWASLGYGKSVLGYPIDNMSEVQNSKFETPFRYQNFANGTENGSLEYNITSGNVFEIHGAIFAKWGSIGYADSVLGLVTTDEYEAAPSPFGTVGRYSKFENGTIHWISDKEGENEEHPYRGEAFVTSGYLNEVHTNLGGTSSDLGFPITDQREKDGHDYCVFEGGIIDWNDSTGTYDVKLGYEGLLFRAKDGIDVYLIENGEKRYFTSPEALEWNGRSFDEVINVSSKTLDSIPSGPNISISQEIIDKYYALKGSTTFGQPDGKGELNGEQDQDGNYCSYVNFENGSIECFKNGPHVGEAYAVLNPLFTKWRELGYGAGILGYPIGDMSEIRTSSKNTDYRYQLFANGTENGSLEYNITSGNVFEIHGAIFAKWGSIGYADSVLGLVTSDERDAVPSFKGTTGRVSDFENGHLHWHGSGDHYMNTNMTYGELDQLYTEIGGTASELGFPITDQKEIDENGHCYCEFENGNIGWNEAEGKYKAYLTSEIYIELYFDRTYFDTVNHMEQTQSHASEFEAGDTLKGYVNTNMIIDDHTVNTYVKMIMPDGTEKYAYRVDPFLPDNPLYFSDEKQPLTEDPWYAETNTWNWDIYKMTGTEPEGTYTWEFWYEDVNTGEVLGKSTASYNFSKMTDLGEFDERCKYYVRVSNIDDLGEIWVNGHYIKNATYYGDSGWVDIHEPRGDNFIEFKVTNAGGDWTYKFELMQNDSISETILWSDSCGVVGETGNGCNKNTDTGEVYDKVIRFKNTAPVNVNVMYAYNESEGDIEKFDGYFEGITDYYNENSYGTISLNFQVADNGNWFQVPHDIQWYNDNHVRHEISDGLHNFSYNNSAYEFAKDVIDGLDENVDYSDFDINLIIYAPSYTWKWIDSPDSPLGIEYKHVPVYLGSAQAIPIDSVTSNNDGSFDCAENWIVFPISSDYDEEVLAHEIGHQMGSLHHLINQDLYPSSGGGSNVSNWDVMHDNYACMSSFSKVNSGWLNFKEETEFKDYEIYPLDSLHFGDEVIKFKPNEYSDDFYIFEYRRAIGHDSILNNDQNRVNEDNPNGVIVIYTATNGSTLHTTTNSLTGKNETDTYTVHVLNSNLENNWNEPTFYNEVSSIEDLFYSYDKEEIDIVLKFINFSVVDVPDGNSAKINVQLENEIGLKGVILQMTNTIFYNLLFPYPLNYTVNPTLSLHAYTDDGNHVGMNYETGEYEVQIPGARTSGLQPNEREWIIVPEDVNVKYVVDSYANAKYMYQNPDLTGDFIDSYDLIGFYFDENGNDYSGKVTEHIAPGTQNEHSVVYSQNLDGTYSIEVSKQYDVSLLPPLTNADTLSFIKGDILPIKFTARNPDTGDLVFDDQVNVLIKNSTGTVIESFNTTSGVQVNSDEGYYTVDFYTADHPELIIGEKYSVLVTFGDINGGTGSGIAYFILTGSNSPSSITNLQSTNGTTWINWTWTNPTDPDFNRTEIYLNNIFQTNTSTEFFNATCLEPETEYTIGTHTVDTYGNVNETWVNLTATTKNAPIIVEAGPGQTVKKGTTVNFEGNFTASGLHTYSFHWDFGDGTNTTGSLTPSHVYEDAGAYEVTLTVTGENGDTGNDTLNITVTNASVSVFPGYTNPPTDPDKDGLYEDINGNGRLGFNDLVAYFANLDWIEENVPLEFFDYNKNGLIDFDDVVTLFDML
ncbi:TPA: PKD domain-containing protein [Methanosarcina acetivorans]|nr:PKD domain-containing protein [Methanosarcina acetivorans]HIH93146.1 PKD domain-containing protein [Methanosarcina acetivorans]